MKPANYQPQVWLAIRALWEAAPKITWREVLEQVAGTLQCEVPSIPAVSLRAKREKWKKKPLKKRASNQQGGGVKKTKREALKNALPFNPSDDCEADGTDGFINGEFRQLNDDENKLDIGLQIIEQAALKIGTSVERVINNHRARNYRLGQFQDRVMEDVQRDIVAAEIIHPSEGEGDDADPLVMQKLVIQKKRIEICGLKVDLLKKIAEANSLIQKTDRESWGIESSGDDGEANRRKADTALLEEKTKSARSGLAAQKAALFDRMKMIESGEIFKRGDDDEEFTDDED